MIEPLATRLNALDAQAMAERVAVAARDAEFAAGDLVAADFVAEAAAAAAAFARRTR